MRSVLIICVFIIGFVSVHCFAKLNLIGPGRWIVDDVLECEDSDQYEIAFKVTREKLNRTHDGFTMYVKPEREFNDLYGIEIDMYQLVDGGYKYYHHISDPNACSFVKQYNQENLEKILALAGLDPPDCPIPPGEYIAKDFVYNYSELKDPSPYGSYMIYSYMTWEDKRVACLKLFVTFQQVDDDED